jgi:hypothetical protein
MASSTTFLEAGERHHRDALHLEADGRDANADQLYGLAAECAVKALLLGLCGIAMRDDAPVRPYRRHINELWPLAAGMVTGLTAVHHTGSLLAANPFAGWSVNDRYAGHGPIDPVGLDAHQKASASLVSGAQLARLDGLL